MSQARAGDVVLVAGKGHEEYQDIAGVKRPFSDFRVAEEALTAWGTRMMTLLQAAELARGALSGPDGGILRVVTDSREAGPGDLFVALKGERFDAHDFVAEVTAKGAAALVRADFELSGVSLIRVDDTRLALGRLASGWAQRLPALRIGVTGSNGKTTVRKCWPPFCANMRARTRCWPPPATSTTTSACR